MQRRLTTALVTAFAAFALASKGAFASTTALAGNPNAVKACARVIHTINPHLQNGQSRTLATHLLQNAAKWKIDANLLVALVTVESRWRTDALSPVGAIGLGQLMPGTAAVLRVNPHNPIQNLSGCAHYLSGLLNKYRSEPNRYQLAFAAYNAGPKAVARFGGIPPFGETQTYVVRVMRQWKHFTAIVHVKPQARAVVAMNEDAAYWNAR